MKTKIFIALFLSCGISVYAQDFYDQAEAVFSEYVREGKVNYKAINANPQKLDAALKSAADFVVQPNKPQEYQAFWINAYNLAVLKGVVDNYPLKSPLDVDGFFDKIKYNLGGKALTLNEIENEQLRAKFPEEARFHFVLVCAGLGCPPLIDRAYRPETLVAQMEQQTKRALNNPEFIRAKGKKVLVSEIFKWYQEDFDRHGGTLKFLNGYREEPFPSKTKIGYYPYNWSLNSL